MPPAPNGSADAGGCLALVLTKFAMMAFTLAYCQIRFSLFQRGDFLFVSGLGALCVGLFALTKPILTLHPAAALATAAYLAALWFLGPRFIGRLAPEKKPGVENVVGKEGS